MHNQHSSQNFYRDQTAAQPLYPSPPPQQKPLPHERLWTLWRRYRAMRKRAQWGIGCLAVFLLCGMCSCVGALAAPSMPQVATTLSPTATQVTLGNTTQATATSTATVHADTSTPTSVPAATPTVMPTPVPTPMPTTPPTRQPAPSPTPKPTCQAVNNNPWCYNFSPGSPIYNPPSAFCSYFACIPSFYEPDDPGDGYIVQCADGLYSQSGGERGACSRHGGVGRTLYTH